MAQPLAGCGSHLLGGDAVDVHSVDSSSKDGAVIHHRADGGTAYVFSQSDQARHICAMPPASAARELARAFSAEADEAGKVHLSSDEKTRALYEQSDRVLFLQFAFYRLCESRANGNFVTEPQGCDIIVDRIEELGRQLIDAGKERSKAELAIEDAKLEEREPTKTDVLALRRARLKESRIRKDWTRAIASRNACQQGSYEQTFVKILDTAVKISQTSAEPEKKAKPKPKKKRRPAKVPPKDAAAVTDAPAVKEGTPSKEAPPKERAPRAW